MARERDVQAYNYIDYMWRDEYRSPTYREIMANTDITSSSLIPRTLERLEEQGVLVISRTKEGNIRSFVPTWLVRIIDADTYAATTPIHKGE